MSLKMLLLTGMAFLILMSGTVYAQKDAFGKMDTLSAEVYKIDAKNWGVNVWLTNDEDIMALSIPLRFTAGKTRVIPDSTIFTGGLVEAFRVKQARIDTAAQSLTIGLINDIGISVPPISPGKGRIATIFVSSPDKADILDLKVDTTTTPPSNTLQLVHPPSTEIVPVFMVKYGEQAKSNK